MRSHTTVAAEAARRARLAGVPSEAVLPYVEAEVAAHPFRIDYESLNHLEVAEIVDVYDDDGDGPTVKRVAIWVKLNLRHAFVSRIMLSDHTSSEERTGMEILLCVVLNAHGNATDGFTSDEWAREMALVSNRLELAVRTLTDPDPKTGENMLGQFPDDDGSKP